MTKNHKKTILHFVDHPGMYIQKIDKENITSFILGFELGTNHKCDFINILSSTLITEFNIPRLSTGWPGQVEKYSETKGIDWVTAFIYLSKEVL